MDNVEENLKLFLTQLDSFSEAIRSCQRNLLEPLEELMSVLPAEKQLALAPITSEMNEKSKSLTEELIPSLHDGLDYRLHILRVYLHEY